MVDRSDHPSCAATGADKAQLFIDGQLIEDRQLPDVHPVSVREFCLRRRFAGTFDGVRVSRTIRYTENFTSPARFEPDEYTVALYRFDEGEGDILHDASGHGHDGKFVGAAWVRLAPPEDAGTP